MPARLIAVRHQAKRRAWKRLAKHGDSPPLASKQSLRARSKSGLWLALREEHLDEPMNRHRYKVSLRMAAPWRGERLQR
jgi:hypothetical protein